MTSLLNQGDTSRLKYLVVWTYAVTSQYDQIRGLPKSAYIRTEFAETEEEAWKIVLNESIRHSVTERNGRTGIGNIHREFILDPNFKVEVLSLSLARGFNDQAFMVKVEEATELFLKQKQSQEDSCFKAASKKRQEQEYATYMALKAKYEKTEVAV